MKLRDLKEALCKAYGDFTLEEAFDNDDAEGDTLALYIAREIRDACEGNTVISQEHLEEMVRVVDFAIRDLEHIEEALIELIKKERQ